MKAALGRVVRKRDELLEDLEGRYTDRAVKSCVAAVGRALEQGQDELVNAGMASKPDELQRLMLETIRSTLISNLQSELATIGDSISSEFVAEIGDVNGLMSSYAMDEDWSGNLVANSRVLLQQTQRGASSLLDHLSNSGSQANTYKVVTTILALTTGVVLPLAELVIIFLPELLRPYLENRRREQLRTTVLTDMIPATKAKLRELLPAAIREQVAQLAHQVSTQFEVSILENQQAIERLESERQQHLDGLQAHVETLVALRTRLSQLAAPVLRLEASA